MESTAPARYEPGPAGRAVWFGLLGVGILLTLFGLLDLVGVAFVAGPMTALKRTIDWMMDPVVYFVLSCVGFVLVLWFRPWTETRWAGLLLFLTVAFVVFSWSDPNFQAIVSKPDNIPIAIMLLLVGFFTWLSLKQGFHNDARRKLGLPPAELTEANKKVWVWPDLIYIEFISMVLFTVILVVWSIVIQAPLEEPANPSNTPNPSKAPWYFLGLQEMLVYYDPWMAGVVLPTLIIVGLMAIPYIDTNPKGNGYYTFDERRWEIGIFLFGFIILWVLLIILGTFLRGPNWNFFGPYEYWDVHKVLALNNVDLSEYVWVKMAGTKLPDFWLIRELPGIILVLLYMFWLPFFLAGNLFKRFYQKMGAPRYYVAMLLFFLPMMSLPIKMFLRWTLNLKYVVHIGEYFFNI